jgi:hypothetical protein
MEHAWCARIPPQQSLETTSLTQLIRHSSRKCCLRTEIRKTLFSVMMKIFQKSWTKTILLKLTIRFESRKISSKSEKVTAVRRWANSLTRLEITSELRSHRYRHWDFHLSQILKFCCLRISQRESLEVEDKISFGRSLRVYSLNKIMIYNASNLSCLWPQTFSTP